jgi:acid phosphatase
MMLSLLKIQRFSGIAILLSVCLFGAACGGGSDTGAGGGTSPTTPPSGQVTFAHVAVVVLENHSYSEVIGNSDMPYLNGLAQQYGLAAQYFANTHPSLPNYFMLTTGKQETTGDNSPGVITDDNVSRELTKAGKSWKCYAEGLPSVGYLGIDVYPYVQHHNPFVFFSDVQNDSSQAANIVPFTQLASDLSSNSLPQYSFIVPNLLDDAHDGTLAQADQWLEANIAPLISNSAFQSSGLLIIAFDEGDASDNANGGGQVATVIVSAQAKKNYVSQTLFQHQSLLRLTLSASGVTTFPGAAASAPDMSGFITGP